METTSAPEREIRPMTLHKLLSNSAANLIPEELRDTVTIQTLRELKALNSKISFIVFVIIIGIIVQLLASCIR